MNSTVCTDCERGKVSEAGAIACLPCEQGKHQNQPGSATCISCVPGTNQPNVGQTECKKCVTGRASKTSANAKIECESCPKGRYQLDTGQTVCLSCQPGKHQDLLGQSATVENKNTRHYMKLKCDTNTKIVVLKVNSIQQLKMVLCHQIHYVNKN